MRDAVRNLNPAGFAFVMATGIVSVAMDIKGWTGLSRGLLAIGVFAWIALSVLHIWRFAAYRDAIRRDLADPARAFGFFTFVAATDVLGTRFVAADQHRLAFVLLVIGALCWGVLGYLIPLTALHPSARRALAAPNGSWFLWVVAGQSVAVLAAVLEPTLKTGRRTLALIAVFTWAVGTFLYSIIVVLVTIRLMMHPISPDELTAPYWVATGATAITVVAGAEIVQMAEAPMVEATRGLVAGTSVLFWCFGTWLIPLLLIGGWWRHVTHRAPLRYETAMWSIIFPLGMYGVASDSLGRADRLPFVTAIGEAEVWIASMAWAVLFVAMALRAREWLWSLWTP